MQRVPSLHNPTGTEPRPECAHAQMPSLLCYVWPSLVVCLACSVERSDPGHQPAGDWGKDDKRGASRAEHGHARTEPSPAHVYIPLCAELAPAGRGGRRRCWRRTWFPGPQRARRAYPRLAPWLWAVRLGFIVPTTGTGCSLWLAPDSLGMHCAMEDAAKLTHS